MEIKHHNNKFYLRITFQHILRSFPKMPIIIKCRLKISHFKEMLLNLETIKILIVTSKQTSKGKQKPRDCFLCVPYPKLLIESQSVCTVVIFNFLTSFIYRFSLTFNTKAWKVYNSVKAAIIYNNNNHCLYSQQSALQKLEIQVWDRLRSLITSCTPALMCNRHWQMAKVLVSLLLTFDPNVLSKELIFFPGGDWKSLKICRSISCEN